MNSQIGSPVVVLEFKGNETPGELYRIAVTSIRDLIRLGLDSQEDLRPLQLDLEQYLALVENEINKRQQMNSVCAWCNKLLKGSPGAPLTSHGICEDCANKMMPSLP